MTDLTLVLPENADAPLYKRLPDQFDPQPAFLELDCTTGKLSATWTGEVGTGVSAAVYHRHTLQWSVDPHISAEALESLMTEVEGQCQDILDGYDTAFDGNNVIGTFSAKAEEAIEQVEEVCESYGESEESLVDPVSDEDLADFFMSVPFDDAWQPDSSLEEAAAKWMKDIKGNDNLCALCSEEDIRSFLLDWAETEMKDGGTLSATQLKALKEERDIEPQAEDDDA